MQHLLGIGHLVRASRVAAAAAAAGLEVTVAVGGVLPDGLAFGGARVVALPPVKAGPGGFGDLVGADGAPFTEARRAARRAALLDAFASARPDILLIEAFPFGRRPMRFELLPLLDAVRAREPPPLVACSVRDILQRSATPGRDAEAVALARSAFDLVLVHGEAGFSPIERSFPLAAALRDRIVEAGLVGPADLGEPPPTERHDVIVSAGGGAVGAGLLRAALAARPRTSMAAASWLVLRGPNLPADEDIAEGPGVSVRAFVPDLAARLRGARLSISQAGYNTVADLLAAPACRAVLVPFAEGGESEQTARAAAMAARGWAVALPADALTPVALARAIDAAAAQPVRAGVPPLDGARRAVAALRETLAARRGRSADREPG